MTSLLTQFTAVSSTTSRQSTPGSRFSWRRLPWWIELATIITGYVAYEVLRAVSPTRAGSALGNAASVLHVERWMHIDIELHLNHALSAHPLLGSAAGLYYGILHFAVTPIVLGYVWWRRPVDYPRLRSALVLMSFTALLVFWAWPVAPPRFALPGAVDTLITRNVLGAGSAHGVSGLVDAYAAMPSLHVGWAVWCAVAIVVTVRSRWRYLAWLYPIATTIVVLATANHYILDAVAGAALSLGMLAVTGSFAQPAWVQSEVRPLAKAA
ncbi:MAG TPA: phosphatase PAP2 family protein [Mycobacteriales bacterium]|jgi:hypothetical protein|nr:phosphatase PAP2 family protein [Mycobacteriales bacterium]